MKYLILNDKNKIENTFTNEKEVVLKLLEILWSKTITKSKWIKRISFNYNYTNNNKITFTTDTNYKFIFEDVPTKLHDIDIYELLKKEM